MRTLVALTVLMLALAAAVWWKTSAAGKQTDPPAVTSQDPGQGILTMGIEGNAARAREASAPAGGGTPAEAGLGGSEVSGPQAGGNAGSDPAASIDPAPGLQPTPPPPPAPAATLRHTVRSGETLYRIVLNAYGTAPPELVRAVADANRLTDPSSIDEGQALLLPVVEGFPAPSAG